MATESYTPRDNFSDLQNLGHEGTENEDGDNPLDW